MMNFLRGLFGRRRKAGQHRAPGIHRAPALVWKLKAERIRAARQRPTVRPPLRILIAAQRMPARQRFAAAARPVQQRAAAARSAAVAVGSSIARRTGARSHRLTTDTMEHHGIVEKIMKRQARDEKRLAKQRARGENAMFSRRPRGEFAW